MLPRQGPNVGWSDSDSTMGREEALEDTRAPSSMLKIMIRPKTDKQDVTKKARKPARKTTSAPSAKAQATGEDKAAKAKTLKMAKVRTAKEPKPKPVKEVKVKSPKQAKAKPAKDIPAKAAKAKPVKEAEMENVKEKSVKKELMESKIAEVKEPKVRRTAATTRKRNRTTIAGQPKWSIPGPNIKLDNLAGTEMPLDRGRPCNVDLSPRIWCNSKEELLSAMPELTKGANGVSWIQSEPPIVFLEDGNMGTIVSDVSTDGSRSMELKMTRSFVCDPADLVEPSDTPPTPKFPCTFRVSPSFQPVELKTSFTFDSRPKFIPAEASQAPLPKPQPKSSRVHQGKPQPTLSTPETSRSNSKPVATKVPRAKPPAALPKPEALQSKPSTPQPISPAVAHPRSSNPAPSHDVTTDIEPESEHDKKHQESRHCRVPVRYIRQVFLGRPHSETLLEYELPTSSSFPSFQSPSIECAPASASTSPSSPTENPRRCTCDMPGNIYCGVCDVTLESETDSRYRSTEPSLRYVPVDCLILMSTNKPHADASDVTMSKNIFDVQSTTSSGAQATCSCPPTKHCFICRLKPIDQDWLDRPRHQARSLRLAKQRLPSSGVRLRIPALGASSRAADTQAIQVLPSSSSNDVQMKAEEPAPTPVEFTPAATHAPPQIPPNLITIPQETLLSDSCIPKILPPEVQVIIDAYISGTPLNVVASKSMLKARWGVSLPAECGYVYMGFFAVAEVLEERVIPSPTSAESTPERAVGHVQWRIKCVWSASGEEDADPALGYGSPQPWWDPVSAQSSSSKSDDVSLFYSRKNPLDPIRRLRNRSHHHTHTNDDGDDAYPDKSTPRYRIARHQHPNARYGLGTGARLGDRYWSVLPNHLRGQLGWSNVWEQGFGYEGIPSGWWCEGCGRVNFQAQWRMRWCVSEKCLKATDEQARPPGLAVPLDILRDPMHVMPLIHSSDTYPGAGSVTESVEVWRDGMRTFSYVVREAGGGAEVPQATGNAVLTSPASALASSSAVPSTSSLATFPNLNTHSSAGPVVSAASSPTPSVVVKHIFTGNISRLQATAKELLLEMQRKVPLQRAIGDPGPYFTYSVSSDPGDSTPSWHDAPAIITRAKETMELYMREYGEDRGYEMNRLDAFSWVATGTKKGNSALKCKKRPVVLMCLGSETIVSVVPKSGFRDPDPRGVGPSNRVLGINLGPDVDVDPDPDLDPDAELEGLFPMDVDGDMDVEMEAPYDDGDTVMLDLEPEVQADNSLPPRQRGHLKRSEAAEGPVLEPAPPSKGKGKGKAKAAPRCAPVSGPAARKPKPKPRKQDISVLLLHGDMMVLVGDDYEYTIKRTGTSILLIGSYVGANKALAMTMPSTTSGRGSKSKRQAKAVAL